MHGLMRADENFIRLLYLFALLLYAGGIYTVMCITARLLWITQQENTAREENTDAIEIMQVWEVDSAVNEDVRGM